jgi:hypothetical protein
MSHLSDKDIDHLAREAAEQLDVDQNSSGWEALQSKLDVEMPVQKRRRRWFLFLLFPLLGGGLFLAYKFNQSGAPVELSKQTSTIKDNAHPSTQAIRPGITEPQTNVEKENNTTDKSSSGASIKESNPTATISKEPVIAPGGQTDAVASTTPPENTGSPSNTAKGKKNISNPNGNGRTSNQGKKAVATTATGAAIVNQSINHPKADKVSPGVTENKASGTSDQTANEKSSATVAVDSSDKAAMITSDSALIVQKNITNDSTGASTSTSKATKKKSAGTLMPYKGFVIGVIGGPDVSKVNGTGTDKRGFNVGLVAGYRFNGRLSLISGLSYTHKYYTAVGSDFKPGGSYWNTVTIMGNVVGDCFMYEMPVNLRYDLVASKKNYAFITAGLSSYLMKQEQYDIHYTTNSGAYNHEQYSSYETKLYWFSLVNLSAGYERMITKRLSVTVEPYIKLPLNGIGLGNMDLSSYGVFLGVRYHAGTLKLR